MVAETPRVITLAAVRRALRDHRPQPADAPGARPAAVAPILVEDPHGLEGRSIRGAERADDPWSGQVALPGGRHEPGDRDLLATAIRETQEETGVDLAAAERLGALDDLYPRTPTLPPVVVRPFVFALERRVVLRSEEHTSDSSHGYISYAVFCLKKKKKVQKESASC